jgi:hypothetical protein
MVLFCKLKQKMEIARLLKDIEKLEKRSLLAKKLQKLKSSKNAKKVLQKEIEICNYLIQIKRLAILFLNQVNLN